MIEKKGLAEIANPNAPIRTFWDKMREGMKNGGLEEILKDGKSSRNKIEELNKHAKNKRRK